MVPYKYALYSSEQAMNMYIEFMNIPDNPLGFDVPNGFMITTDMMRTFIDAAYAIKGVEISSNN